MADALTPNDPANPTRLTNGRISIGVGDWICFHDGGSLSYGEVQYVRQQPHYPKTWLFVTSNGVATWDGILERRRAVATRGGDPTDE